MTEHAEHAEHAHNVHEPSYYIKIWAVLVVLLVVSVVGPMIGIQWLTLLTAFGIALVKAYLVVANFMHLNIEKKWVIYMLTTALAFMGLFYFGVAPDVMKHEGTNWQNVAAKAETERALAEQKEHAEHGGDHGEAAHGEAGHH